MRSGDVRLTIYQQTQHFSVLLLAEELFGADEQDDFGGDDYAHDYYADEDIDDNLDDGDDGGIL